MEKKEIKLSVVTPSIYPDKLEEHYKSLLWAYSESFELISVGPYKPTEKLQKCSNVVWIEDWSRPSCCFQRGLLAARGEFVMFNNDDAIFYPGMVDKTFALHDGDYKTVISSKYLESDLEVSKKIMIKDDYYTVHYHPVIASDSIPKHFQLWQTGIAKRELLLELGGVDCAFEAMPISTGADLGVRMQFFGCKLIPQQGFSSHCGWTPDREDHPPTQATWQHDIPLYRKMQENKRVFQTRIKIPLDNHKYYPKVWARRNK